VVAIRRRFIWISFRDGEEVTQSAMNLN